MGPRVGLDGCGKSRHGRDSTPGPSSTERFAIQTKLSRPTIVKDEQNIKGDFFQFRISNSRCVQNVVLVLLGDSLASVFSVPTFHNTLLHLHRPKVRIQR